MKLLRKGFVTVAVATLLVVTSTAITKAETTVNIDIAKGSTFTTLASNTITASTSNNTANGFFQKTYPVVNYKGEATVSYTTSGNFISFNATKIGHVSFTANESSSYSNIKTYKCCIHNVATDIQFSSESMAVADEIYLYEGESATISCVTLPYNSAIQNNTLNFQNAIQGNWIKNNNTSLVTSSISGSTISLKALKAGDGTITVGDYCAGSDNAILLSPTANRWSQGKITKELKVHVRKKPTLSLSTSTTNIAFNKTLSNALVATVTNNSNKTLLYTWKSSKSGVLKVAGEADNATLTSFATEGEVTISCELTDDVHMYNPLATAIKKTLKINVVDCKLTFSNPNIKDNGDVYFNENAKSLVFDVNEIEDVAQNWTSSNESVATVVYDNGKVTITKTGVGTSNITCISSTGNFFSFNLISRAATVNVKSTSPAEKGMRIEWDKVAEAKYYNVYRGLIKDGSFRKIGVSNTNSYIDADANYGTTYYYKITAVPTSEMCESYNSNTISGILIPATPKIKRTAKSYGQIRFDFEGQLYDGYILDIGKTSKSFKMAASTKMKFASIALEKGTYYARVCSYVTVNGTKVCGKYSNIVKLTVDGSGNISIKVSVAKAKIKSAKRNKNKTSFKIIVKKVKGAKGYQIKYSTSKKFTKKATKTTTSKKLSKTIKKIKKNKVYYVKVRAYKTVSGKKKYGKWSTVKKVKK